MRKSCCAWRPVVSVSNAQKTDPPSRRRASVLKSRYKCCFSLFCGIKDCHYFSRDFVAKCMCVFLCISKCCVCCRSNRHRAVDVEFNLWLSSARACAYDGAAFKEELQNVALWPRKLCLFARIEWVELSLFLNVADEEHFLSAQCLKTFGAEFCHDSLHDARAGNSREVFVD